MAPTRASPHAQELASHHHHRTLHRIASRWSMRRPKELVTTELLLPPDGQNRSSLRELCQTLYRVRRALECNMIRQTLADFLRRPHEHPFTWRIAHTHIGFSSRDRRLIKPDRLSPRLFQTVSPTSFTRDHQCTADTSHRVQQWRAADPLLAVQSMTSRQKQPTKK